MAWDVRSTYYYLVCFATLLMVVLGAVQVVQQGLDLLLPREAYRPSVVDLTARFRSGPGEEVPYTREELEAMAEEEAERMHRQQRHDNLRGLLGSLALVLIAAPVYVYHWRQVRRREP